MAEAQVVDLLINEMLGEDLIEYNKNKKVYKAKKKIVGEYINIETIRQSVLRFVDFELFETTFSALVQQIMVDSKINDYQKVVSDIRQLIDKGKKIKLGDDLEIKINGFEPNSKVKIEATDKLKEKLRKGKQKTGGLVTDDEQKHGTTTPGEGGF